MRVPFRPIRLRPPAAGRRPPAGQSLVEFMLLLVFTLILMLGVLDLGRVYFTYLALKDAAAEGAYFGSVYPQCVDEDGVDVDGNGLEDEGAACAADHNVAYRVAQSAVRGGLVDWSNATISTTLPVTLVAGQVLTVSVSYDFMLITPFAGALTNGQVLTLRASSAATIVRVPNCASASGCQ